VLLVNPVPRRTSGAIRLSHQSVRSIVLSWTHEFQTSHSLPTASIVAQSNPVNFVNE
jgi:hypothetical protein